MEQDIGLWQVVSYTKKGDVASTSKPMTWFSAYTLWERKNSRSPRRFAIRKAQ